MSTLRSEPPVTSVEKVQLHVSILIYYLLCTFQNTAIHPQKIIKFNYTKTFMWVPCLRAGCSVFSCTWAKWFMCDGSIESAINVQANQISDEISPTRELQNRSGPLTDNGQGLTNNFLENNPMQAFLVRTRAA